MKCSNKNSSGDGIICLCSSLLLAPIPFAYMAKTANSVWYHLTAAYCLILVIIGAVRWIGLERGKYRFRDNTIALRFVANFYSCSYIFFVLALVAFTYENDRQSPAVLDWGWAVYFWIGAVTAVLFVCKAVITAHKTDVKSTSMR